MPFDSPHQMPFGDIELLMDARSRISDREVVVTPPVPRRRPPLPRSCAVVGMWEP